MLDTQGAISVYRPAPSPPATPTLVFKSDSNVMIMYGISTTYLLISTYVYLIVPPQVQEPLLPVPRRDLLLDLGGGGADSAGLLLAAGLADTPDCRGEGGRCLASSGVDIQSST